MKRYLKNLVRLKKISTYKRFPVRVRVTLFTDHLKIASWCEMSSWLNNDVYNP